MNYANMISGIILDGLNKPLKGRKEDHTHEESIKEVGKNHRKRLEGFKQRESLVELTKVGARMAIEVAIEEELTALLRRSYYERRTDQEAAGLALSPGTMKIGCGDIKMGI